MKFKLALLSAALISACMISGTSVAAEKYEIAVVAKVTGIPWFNRMETGVNEAAKKLDVNAYQTGPSTPDPAQQVKVIEDLIAKGHIVAFVGDGVNDSPSLAMAQIGIAMGSGTDVAIETSDVVLMNSDFSRLPHALGMAKATASNMRQNIVIAVGVVIFLLLNVFFSEWMSMSMGMLVHEASILVVIINGMRLLRYKLRY